MKKFFLIVLSGLGALGCQKDDICPPGTETTPLLNIELYAAEDPERLKAIQDLVVIASGQQDTLLGPTTINTLNIPLRTDETFTEYLLIANAGSDQENIDVVSFNYSPDTRYLNRACGFEVNFMNLDVTVHEDDNNWILSETILQENVENEEDIHLTFTH